MILANNQAKEILKQATEHGLSDKEIAQICSVSLGSVRRWRQNGRASTRHIAKLEILLGLKEPPRSTQLKNQEEIDLLSQFFQLATKFESIGYEISLRRVVQKVK